MLAAGGLVAARTEASGALPGVGIAVALVPPLATVGMTAGPGLWGLALGALLLIAIIVVGVPLFAHSLQRLEQGDALAAVAEGTAAWAPDLVLTDAIVDRAVEPIAVTVGRTVAEPPPDPSLLAASLTENLGAAVDVDVAFVALTTGSAPAP